VRATFALEAMPFGQSQCDVTHLYVAGLLAMAMAMVTTAAPFHQTTTNQWVTTTTAPSFAIDHPQNEG
jgi:hypothetical protein